MLSVSCLFLTACDDDKRDSLDFSQDVNIHEFTINGVQGVIDNETMMIKVMLPPKSDVTSLVPDIKVADNAVYVYKRQAIPWFDTNKWCILSWW